MTNRTSLCHSTTVYGSPPCNHTSVLSFDGSHCTPVQCGGTIFSISGHIQSPHWPNMYSNPVFCQWSVVLPEQGKRVKVVIDEIRLRRDYSSCFWNYLIVYNTNASTGLIPPWFGRYCGGVPPPPLIASGNIVHIWYQLRLPPDRGFTLSFSAI